MERIWFTRLVPWKRVRDYERVGWVAADNWGGSEWHLIMVRRCACRPSEQRSGATPVEPLESLPGEDVSPEMERVYGRRATREEIRR